MSNHILFNEKELMALTARGNESAFASLFNFYRDRIYSIAFKLTHSPSIAEEVVQDVFLKIWLRKADLGEINNFAAYLFTVTRNNVHGVLKQMAKNIKLGPLEELGQPIAENSEDLLMEKEYNYILHSAVERLPAKQKQVYKLIKDEGLKRDEVAHLLQLQPETVKFHMSQAMKNVRAFCVPHIELYTAVAVFNLYFILR